MIDNALIENSSLGRFFIVGKASTPNLSEIKATYPDWSDGTQMFYATIDAAINVCVASRGDRIIVLPGHTEAISSNTALNLDIAGIQIIGLGKGTVIPTITLDTGATVRIPVSAANITVKGIKFVANFADIATLFLLTTAQGFVVTECEFADTASNLNFLALITTTVAVVADNLKFNKNYVTILGTTAATTPIKILGTHDRIQINDNYINKAALSNTSHVLAHGALVVTNLEMARNQLFTPTTDSSGGAFLITTSSTTNSGMVHDNQIKALDSAAELLVTAGSKYGMNNNLYDGDADASGFVSPAIGSTA